MAAAQAAHSLRARLLNLSLKQPISSSSHSPVSVRHLETLSDGKFGAVRGFTAFQNTIGVENVATSSGLRRALRSFGLGFKGLSDNGTAGKRFIRVSSGAQQQSLVTPSEVQEGLQSGGDAVAQTVELVAQTREMQLKSIDEARARIFGHVIGNGERSAHKVLRKKLIGDKIVAWYPTPIQKLDPMFEDPNIKRRQLKTERQKRRGKGPPKKGHGKRAAKRAK